MLDSSKYGVLYGTMKKYISTLADHAIFYGKSETRTSIIDVVKEESSLFLFLAEQVNAEAEAKGILEKFKQVFLVDAWEEKAPADYSSKKIEDLKDDVNYLKVCVKNICDVDLDSEDSLVLEKISVEEKVDPAVGNYDSGKYQKIPDSLAVFRNALNDEIDLDPTVGKELGDFILRSHAYERLNKDISDGSIYIYTSKPKINVIIKYILLGLSAIGVFSSILLLLSLCRNLYDSTDSYPEGVSWCLSATAGIIYFVFSIISCCKNLKNDNFKYSFGKKDFFYSNFFITMILIMMLPPMKGKSVTSTTNSTVANVTATVLLIVSVVFVVINVFSYFCLQPKKDTKLVDSILERHMSDLSKGTSF